MGIRSRARGNDEATRTARPGPRRAATATATLLAAALALTACSQSPDDGGAEARSNQAGTKSRKGTPPLPVPRGKGSRAARDTAAPPDFNGDGHPDLILDELAKGPDDPQGDDAGIGIVYGSERGLVPGARQLLSPARTAAEVEGCCPPPSTPRPPVTWTGTGTPTWSSPPIRRSTGRGGRRFRCSWCSAGPRG
ncbi:hypothetical protein OIM90_16195 [Streptomyces sp. AD16]|nr:hypothetical protein OIM90_16195 [Streptomyces sp. AD16]